MSDTTKTARNVMMSAHALCSTDASHPERMQWMADYFLANYAAPSVATPDEAMRKDAARYRWLKGQATGLQLFALAWGVKEACTYGPPDHGLDETLDAAMSATPPIAAKDDDPGMGGEPHNQGRME